MNYLSGEEARVEGLHHLAAMYLPGEGTIRRFGLSRKGNRLLGEALREYGSFERVYRQFSSGLSLDDFANQDNGFSLARERFTSAIESINGLNYTLVRKVDAPFPSSLNRFNDSPAALYCAGNLGYFDLPLMAVVGTREPSLDSVKEAKRVVKRLVSSERAKEKTDGTGYCIVSGLALGSDTIGHQVAMQEGGKTIAVLGTDLSRFYPLENRDLQVEIARTQLLVSQYPFGLELPRGSGFVQRNYTVACLSEHGALIVQASDKSGTKYVINHIPKLGRRLFVLSSNKDEKHRWLDKHRKSITFVKG